MPTKVEKDSITGTETTGHEWDGIKELNTPLPRWWLYVFYATILWSVVYYVLYPSIPYFTGYTKGIIGGTERQALDQKLQDAHAAQAVYLDRIQTASLQDIGNDPELLNFAIAGGRAACHGEQGQGMHELGAPQLNDQIWLYGGSKEAIVAQVTKPKQGVMPAWGNRLDDATIKMLATYVHSLGGGQ